MKSDRDKRPAVGLAVYIRNDEGEMLLLKRGGSHGAGTWHPPGGHLENGESFLDCAKRECEEEVNLIIKDVEVLGVTNDYTKEWGTHYITVQILAKHYSGKLKIMAPKKCSEIGWFNLNNLPTPLFLPVKHFFESKFSKRLSQNEQYNPPTPTH